MIGAKVWSLWGLMERIAAGKLMWVSALMLGWHEHLRQVPYSDFDKESSWYLQPKAEAEQFAAALDHAASVLGQIGAPITARIARELISLLCHAEEMPHGLHEGKSLGKFIPIGEERRERIQSASLAFSNQMRLELDEKLILVLGQERQRLIDAAEPLFGKKVDEVFPDCADDIHEAGKCLALGVPTASVYHIMRAAEAAASAVSGKLGGKTHKEDGEPLTFGGLFNQVSPKIDSMPRGPERDDWLHLKGLMATLNRGVRTKVAHPGTWYQDAKAEAIFGQAKAFMQEAADLVDR